ncbi:MAG: preprotein translocase subunit YajC, partial [Clostridiaceae bacterium]|nr:preprotein translocase subunit YajC [Clostridiaceae bacterium]
MNLLLTAFAEGAATDTAEMAGGGWLAFLVQFGPLILLFGLMYVI